MDKNLNPQIAIVGAGAVGSLLGGMLARNGENVTLIGHKAHTDDFTPNPYCSLVAQICDGFQR